MVFETKIIGHRNVADGTHEVTMERPEDFTFQAGQYTQVAVSQLTSPDPKGHSRQFSVVSSPEDQSNVRVVFRATGSGFKETLIATPVGSTVMLEQASGSFILPQKSTQSHIFVAGGVGIAPFMSYLYQRMHDAWDYPVTLIYGNRNPESAAYLSEIQSMEKKHQNFSLDALYTKPAPELFAELTKKHVGAIWWIVGPPGMVAVTAHGLEAGGVLGQDIITESFEGYQ